MFTGMCSALKRPFTLACDTQCQRVYAYTMASLRHGRTWLSPTLESTQFLNCPQMPGEGKLIHSLLAAVNPSYLSPDDVLNYASGFKESKGEKVKGNDLKYTNGSPVPMGTTA